jgi:hypothetical protein
MNRLAVEVTYARAFAKARCTRAYVLLEKIADRIPDDDPKRVYYGGAAELAYAAGLAIHGEPLTPTIRVRVAQMIAQCVALGALERSAPGFRGQRAEYHLILPDVLPRPVDNSGP